MKKINALYRTKELIFLTSSKVILVLLLLGPPLKRTLLEEVNEKVQVINRQRKPNVKARGPLWSLTNRPFPITGEKKERKKENGLDSGSILRTTKL